MSEPIRNVFRAIPVFQNVRPVDFSAEDLPDHPLPALTEWILAGLAAGQPEPHAMSLCTVAADGTPSSRVLLCKDIDAHRLYFATHSDSRKGVAIAANPRVSVNFYWSANGRQVQITGRAQSAGREASERDFAERGRGSQLSAHLHRAEPPSGHEEILAEHERLSGAYPDVVPCPETWTLYGITPDEAEFWQASPDRIHQRVRYTRSGDTWQKGYLWP
ncbi:pyridoxal 5'-phosphate synthase [Streptomyces sp. NPDC006458]|uniref:pyridoxine/pyridoxamine 5'-phosphate oxidase n=1 Tax=Streptomyces sp. NPDC006458 TaxID=3154302 RepID=UPI0033BF51A7